MLSLEPTDGRWAARQIEVAIDARNGLGVELSEFSGSGQTADGVACQGSLVLVSGLVEGGGAWAQAQGAVAGEAVVSAGDAVVGVSDGTGTRSIRVEGFGFDAVVGAIGEIRSKGGSVRLTLKRLVRRGVAAVTVAMPDGTEFRYNAFSGENLRMGLLARGKKVNDQSSLRYDNKPTGTGDCGGNGLCCTCVVSVTAGLESLSAKATSERQLLANSPGRYRQSCKARVAVADGEEARVRLVIGPRGESSLADAESILGPEWRR